MAVTQPVRNILRIDLMSMKPGSYSEDMSRSGIDPSK